MDCQNGSYYWFLFGSIFLLIQLFDNFREEKGTSSSSSTQLLGAAAGGAVAKTPLNLNPHTGMVYSQNYHNLYRKRITLPVFEYRADFMRLLAEHQRIVLVGETGSGKTTQIPQWCVEYARTLGNNVDWCIIYIESCFVSSLE